MTETQFLMALAQTTTAYCWKVDGKKITGTARNGKTRGTRFNPLTAVCRSSGLGNGTNAQAATKLGVTKTLRDSISGASAAKSNRGNFQVLRGKMRQVLDV